jgi:hypothetical protein
MDKIILSEEQLIALEKFIQKRGIKEPDVIAEILDHFACKVEELMTEYPHNNFETAVRRAHQSFGTTGFRTLAKAYEDGLSNEIWHVYKHAALDTILSPKILLILSIGFVANPFYKILAQLFTYNNWLTPKDCLLLILISILLLWRITMYIVLNNSFGNLFSFTKKNRPQNLWQLKVGRVFSLSSISILIGQFMIPNTFNINGMAIVCSVLITMELFCFSAHEETIRCIVALYGAKHLTS